MACRVLTPDYIVDFLDVFRAGLDSLEVLDTCTVAKARKIYTAEHVGGLMAEGRISGFFEGDVLEGILVQAEDEVADGAIKRALIPWIMARNPGNGAGSALMSYCLETARGGNKDVVALIVSKRNTKAIRFYERLGFEENTSVGRDKIVMCYYLNEEVRPSP
tara:strand:- start:446 stop:931 length:486 start_codon:yes stop_codon:yes gene_type:complete